MTNAQTAVLAAASLTAPQGATLTSVAQRLAVKTAIQNWLDKGSDLNNGDPIACTFTDTYHRRTGSVLATRQAVCLAACSAFDSDDWQLPKQITDYCDIIATAYDVG